MNPPIVKHLPQWQQTVATPEKPGDVLFPHSDENHHFVADARKHTIAYLPHGYSNPIIDGLVGSIGVTYDFGLSELRANSNKITHGLPFDCFYYAPDISELEDQAADENGIMTKLSRGFEELFMNLATHSGMCPSLLGENALVVWQLFSTDRGNIHADNVQRALSLLLRAIQHPPIIERKLRAALLVRNWRSDHPSVPLERAWELSLATITQPGYVQMVSVS